MPTLFATLPDKSYLYVSRIRNDWFTLATKRVRRIFVLKLS